MKAEKNQKSKVFIEVICVPTIAATTGFGIMFIYILFGWNPLISVFLAMFGAALMAKILVSK